MPHDLNGHLVEVGQIVSVKFKVTAVMLGDDYCNCSLESIQGMPPEGTKTILSAINTRQIEVASAPVWRQQEDTVNVQGGSHG